MTTAACLLWPRAPLLSKEVDFAFVLPTKYGKCRQMNPLIAIYAWPVISVVLFNKYRLPVAALVCMLGGFLFLPETIAIDLPVLPSLDKYSIPVLATVVLGAMLAQNSPKTDVLKGWIPKSLLLRFLGIAFVFGAFMTVVTNRDPLVFPLITLPGLRFYDAFSAILSNIIFLLPMIAARKFLAKPEHHVLILIALAIAGFGYSFLALYEVRMSPQLNSIVYGFFPHSWVQHIRGGGYRPLVFLSHGLLLSLFLSMSFLAAAALYRIFSKQKRTLAMLALPWLLMAVVLSKTLGALLILAVTAPFILFAGARIQLLIAAVIAVTVLFYPILRGTAIVPADRISSIALSINAERASSLQTRFDNEDALLSKAKERPLFGWGGWGRSRVKDENGTDISIVDGYWVLSIGLGGWVRYLTVFGMLTIPILLLTRHHRRYQIGRETVAIGVILAANLIDLIPNAGITPVTWLLAGAIWGRLELGRLDPAPQVGHADPQTPKAVRRVRGQRQRSYIYTDEPAVSEKRPYARPHRQRSYIYQDQKDVSAADKPQARPKRQRSYIYEDKATEQDKPVVEQEFRVSPYTRQRTVRLRGK